MTDRAVSMDSEASVYTLNSSSLSDGHQLPRPKPATFATATHFLWIWSIVVRHGKWICLRCFIEIVVDGVYTYTWHRSAAAGARRNCRLDDGHGSPSPLSSAITPNFVSAMRMKIEDGRNEKGGAVSEDEEKNLDTTRSGIVKAW